MKTAILPVLVTEIHRYANPSRFGFIFLRPSPEEDTWGSFPFTSRDAVLQNRLAAAKRQQINTDELGPMYKTSEPSLLLDVEAAYAQRNSLIANGFRRYTLARLPETLRDFVIAQQAPVEWQWWLRNNDLTGYENIRVWVLGEFPEDVS